ncbi:MAG TPA: hypothetical protein VHF89_12430 [Solirubrobacteraceae bacterium]|nr:hypothetical protein [Solirubrobacteraceae bacterium]
MPKNAGSEPGISVCCGTPTRPTAPPGRAMRIAVSTAAPWPTHSSTECTPSPPVSSRTRSTASSPRSDTTSVAPYSRASAMRSGWRPMMMICSAPSRLAAMTAHSPTAPSPTTAARFPGATAATTAAWWPVPMTSDSVSSDGMSASSSPTGSGYSVPSASGTRSASAWAPFMPSLPKKPTCTHAVGSPSRQNEQVPSEYANGMTTTSPFSTVVTCDPTSSTTPTASWPIDCPVSERSIDA